MRVLLLSCNTGEGHNSTAKAIMSVLEDRGVECKLVDVLACLSPRFSKFVCNWHVRLYKYAPKLSDVGYRAVERNTGDPDDTSPVYELLALGAKKLWDMVVEGNFDAIVCVHVFSAMMMTEVRRSFASGEPCYFVATDYSVAPMLEQCDLDGYFIPAEDLKEEYVQQGIPGEKLIPVGIPVRKEFYESGDRAEARKKLDLPENGLVALLMCGSMGCGPIRKIAKDLSRQLLEGAMLVAICGRNEKLFESMKDLGDPRLRVLGYTTEIPAYMDAADLIVTKPGGLSATEAACKHLPMVFINAVGGCEGRNFDRFLERGYACGSKEPEEVVEQAAALAADPEARSGMTALLERDFSENTAVSISDRVMDSARKYAAAKKEFQMRILERDFAHPQDTGGCDMEFMQSKTRINLARSFAGESQARTRYTIYAKQARKEGREWIARIFEETAANEAVHAEEFLEMMQHLGSSAENIDLEAGFPFQLGDTAQNLAFAAAGEMEEHSDAYPGFAEIARREGFDDAARLWLQIARIEGVHHNAFQSLNQQLTGGTLTEKKEPATWRCLNCGYTYESTRAADPCPVCGKDAGWQEGQLDKKKMMSKK